MLNQNVHLASCSLAARSLDLDEALGRMLDAMQRHGAPWGEFEEQAFQARNRFAALVNAHPEQIALVPNASVGAYQVASSIDWTLRPKVLTTEVEFPSIAHVWLAQRARGAVVRHVREHRHTVAAGDYLAEIDAATAVVSVPLTTYRTGARLDAAEIAQGAHAEGALVFVDAYQAVGVERIDVTELDCDYLVAGSMKYLLGLPGIAFLYARTPEGAGRTPELTGWFGRVDPFAFDPFSLDFARDARRFETGTPAVPSLYAANAGLGLIAALDLDEVRRHVARLTAIAARRLVDQGETVLVPDDPDARGAHLAIADPDASAVAAWLGGHRVVVSPRGDVVRASFHYYNDDDDVDALCTELASYRATATSTPSRWAAPARLMRVVD